MKKILFIIPMALCALCLASCDKGDIIPLVRLGSRQSVITLNDAGAGSTGFDIISDGDYAAEVAEGAEWLRIDECTQNRLEVSFFANKGFRRAAKIRISKGSRVDSMYVRQPGAYNGFIRFSQTVFAVPAAGGSYSVDVASNLAPSTLVPEALNAEVVRYLRFENNVLSFDVLPATDMNRRNYTVSLYCLDGWGERVQADLTLTQEAAQ